MSSRVEKKASAREKAAQIRLQQQRAEQRRRLIVAGAAVLVVVLIVGALVVAKLAGAGDGSKTATPAGKASAAVVKALRSVPTSVSDGIAAGGAQGGPKKISAPVLTADGKPRVLYLGAEYCPYCAAERWPVALALSRFGTFTGLGSTTSSAEDVFPSTPTLSFHGATFSSPYVSFTGIETTTNKKEGNGYEPLDTPSAEDAKLVNAYNKPPYVSSGGAIPFIDVGGTYVSSGATYSPQLLADKTQEQIAAALKDPSSDIAKSVVGSANLFSAAICRTTGGKPAAVCTSSGVTKAAAQLGGS